MSSAYIKRFNTVTPAIVEWRDGLPFSPKFDDVYFSSEGAVEETNHVFISGNQLLEDWQQQTQKQFTLVELGFGTGLNFLVTASHWHKLNQTKQQVSSPQSNTRRQSLQYISIEKHPLKLADLKKAHALWPEFRTIAETLHNQYPSPSYGRFQIDFFNLNITLILLFMPVQDALGELQNDSRSRAPRLSVDHWFLDGFAPAKNNQMWQHSVFNRIADLSHTGTRLATFSVASAVKTPLKQLGFELKKRKGFGRKREMLTATYHATKSAEQTPQSVNIKYEKPWFNIAPCSTSNSEQANVAIIGGGIAGCSLAYTLAQKSFNVDLYESNADLANGASGAAAGIFHPQITTDLNLTSQFSWQAYLCLLSFLKTLPKGFKQQIIQSKGLLRYLDEQNSARELLNLANQFHLNTWVQSGIEQQNGQPQAIYYPDAGALNMTALCHYYIEVAQSLGLTLYSNQKVDNITAQQNHWQVKTTRDSKSYDHIVYCGGAKSSLIEQFNQLPTNTSRGQTCYFEQPELASKISQALCEQVYLVPYDAYKLLIGTSFENSDTESLSQKSQQQILQKASAFINKLGFEGLTDEQIASSPLKGMVGFRLHSKDRLPLVGAAFDGQRLQQDFAKLGQQKILRNQLRHYNRPGLWLNTGYGSHGLNYSLLCSQYLSSLMQNQFSSVSNSISNAINPARYYVRSLKTAK